MNKSDSSTVVAVGDVAKGDELPRVGQVVQGGARGHGVKMPGRKAQGQEARMLKPGQGHPPLPYERGPTRTFNFFSASSSEAYPSARTRWS